MSRRPLRELTYKDDRHWIAVYRDVFEELAKRARPCESKDGTLRRLLGMKPRGDHRPRPKQKSLGYE